MIDREARQIGPNGTAAEEPSRSRGRTALLVVFLLALALRLLHLWFSAESSPFYCAFNVDDLLYHEWANRIAEGELTEGKVFFLAPGFPYFLGCLYTVFGPEPLPVILVQIALSSLTCCFVAAAGRMLFGSLAGFLAGMTAALYGPFILFSEVLLSETLHLFLALGALVLFLKSRRSGSLPLWIACGLVCGMATVTRSYFLLADLLLAAWIVLGDGRLKSAGMIRSAAFLAGVGAVVALPALHNLTEADDLVLINSSGGHNFFMGNHEGANGRYHVPPGLFTVDEVRPPRAMEESFRKQAEKEACRLLKPSEISDFYFDKGIDYIKSEPGGWTALLFHKLKLVLMSHEYPGDRNYYQVQRFSPLLRFTPGRFPVVLALALVGLFAIRRQLTAAAPLLIIGAVAFAVLIGFYVTDRFRLALVPTLIILSGAGLTWLWQVAAARRTIAAGVGLAAFAVLFTGSLLLSSGEVEESYMSFHNLGEKFYRKGRFEEAAAAFESSLEREPRFIAARKNLALTLEKLPGRRNDLVREWQTVHRLAVEQERTRIMWEADAKLRQFGATPERGPGLPPGR